MAQSRQSVAQTIQDVLAWRPVLAPILRTFEPLLVAQEKLTSDLSGDLAAAGLRIPDVDAERFGQGVPLLAGATFAGSAPVVRRAAQEMLPLLAALDAVAPHEQALARFFGEDEGRAPRIEAFLAAMTADDRASLQAMADKEGIDAQILGFAGGFVACAVLHAMVAQVPTVDGQAPWDRPGTAWRYGHCPACGALPGIAWLDRATIDEKNPYLVGGGGKKHLHCTVCGADWAFRRSACPACGEEGNKNMEILRESGISHGERIEWCNRCRGYCPCVDLRERQGTPDMDALALGMMHLDLVASQKDLHPLRATFWNLF